MQFKHLVQAGMAGTATFAVIVLCISILGFIPADSLLFAALFSLLLSALWGTTAALLTRYVWRRHSSIVSYSLGAGGCFIGYLAFGYFIVEFRLQQRLPLSETARTFLFGVCLIVTGILAEVLLMLLLVSLRQLWRMGIGTTTARPSNTQDKAD